MSSSADSLIEAMTQAGVPMNVPVDSNDRVVLAHHLPFRLGPLLIEPAMRRITHEDGREEILEQRVTQVLVALARAKGAILSRDDLLACCWDGRIVGDDAINRVMSRLRRAAEGIGNGVFRIETITKVGYRIALYPFARAIAEADSRRPPRYLRTWWAAALMLMLGSALGVGLLLWRPAAGDAGTVVRVDPFEVRADDAAARDFGRALAADLSRFANAAERGFTVVEPGATGGPGADYVVRASIRSERGWLRAHARLVRTSDGEIVWSHAFERPLAEADALREQAAVRIADVMTCTESARQRNGGRFSAESLRLIFSICGQLQDQRFSEVRALLQRLVQREPEFASGWAWLALFEALEATNAPRPEDHPLFGEARRHATRALALDARAGDAYVALSLMTAGPHRWVERARIIERGLALNPDHGLLWQDYSPVLRNLGRMNESVPAARRGAALDPLSPYRFGTLVQALIFAGQPDSAAGLLAEGERRWPERMPVNRFFFAVARGDAARALAMVDNSSYLRERLEPNVALMRLDLETRLAPTSARRQRLLAAFRAAVAAEPRSVGAADMLVFHGMKEEAIQLLGEADPADWEPEILFMPAAAALRRDPRILDLAHRHGLVRYWAASGKWPDFCAQPDLPFDCRAEARRLLAPRR
jgi:DNA-binding winged helix-turn-helix (wHTH) protein/TolB-like protein